MILHSGGTMAEKGTYWDPTEGVRINLAQRGILPGAEGRGYLRISPLGLLVIAPLFGVMFVLFLPFLGVGVLLILCVIPVISALVAGNGTAVQVCCRVTGRQGAKKVAVCETGHEAGDLPAYTRAERHLLYVYLT